MVGHNPNEQVDILQKKIENSFLSFFLILRNANKNSSKYINKIKNITVNINSWFLYSLKSRYKGEISLISHNSVE
jgi:hypothetical protein